MEQMQCPHCMGAVPRGAKVCTGCGAEISYGTPKGAIALAILLPIFIATKAAAYAHAQWQIGLPVQIGTFVILLCAGLYLCRRVYAKRVNFKRRYYQ